MSSSVVVLAAAGCGDSGEERTSGEQAPPSIESQLPIKLNLANLCPGTETPPATLRKLRRQSLVLLREMHRHPDWLVNYTYYDDHGEDETVQITIRQLGKEQLEYLRDNPGTCEPRLQRKLREAVS